MGHCSLADLVLAYRHQRVELRPKFTDKGATNGTALAVRVSHCKTIYLKT